jgi:hypothetical protein
MRKNQSQESKLTRLRMEIDEIRVDGMEAIYKAVTRDKNNEL